MRTTIDLPDSLLVRVRKLMAQRQTTLRALVEEGLIRVLEEGRQREPFRLRDAAFKGEPGFAEGAGPEDLPGILREINEGRPVT